jgi:hypothetical protein
MTTQQTLQWIDQNTTTALIVIAFVVVFAVVELVECMMKRKGE